MPELIINTNEVVINFIDIGQGDACLIRGNQSTVLIDTGGITFGKGDNGKSVLIPFIRNLELTASFKGLS